MWSCASWSSSLGGDARLDMRREHVQHFGGQPAGHAHALDVAAGFECDRHGRDYPIRANKMPASCRYPSRLPRQHRPHAATSQHLMHFEGGNALSRFPRQALLPRLQGSQPAHRGGAGAPCALGACAQAARAATRDKLAALLQLRRAGAGAAARHAGRRHAAPGHGVALGQQGHRHRPQLRPGGPAHRARHRVSPRPAARPARRRQGPDGRRTGRPAPRCCTTA